jgi:glutathionyl-hydroquinone reductase
MLTTLTQNQARGILKTLELLHSMSASVDRISIGSYTTFVRLDLGYGYLVKYNGVTVEDYATLQEFAAAYNLVWG